MSDYKGWADQFRKLYAGKFMLMVILLSACGRGWAQTTGSLLGVITDSKGAVVPSANVRVTDTDTDFIKKTVSTAEGTYLAPLLPVGHYSISVEANGFKSFTRTDVLVDQCDVGTDDRYCSPEQPTVEWKKRPRSPSNPSGRSRFEYADLCHLGPQQTFIQHL